MPKQKLKKFTELNEFTNVAQFNQADAKHKLNNFLNNTQNIILELACGKGTYALALARLFTNKKIIGIDIQGERLWVGAKQALEQTINNVLFLRIQIENLLEYFDPHSISEIWLTFPDPFPRDRQIKKRLSSPRFLAIYKQLLIAKGLVHLKTDDLNLFNYSLDTIKTNQGKIIEELRDIYNQSNISDILKIQTDFEKQHLKAGKNIHYLKFTL